jgi:hypothetical protein
MCVGIVLMFVDCILTMPRIAQVDPGRRTPSRGGSITKRPPWGLYSHHIRSHNIDDPLDTGQYIQQKCIRFDHMICRCTNNIGEVIG